MWIRGHNDYCMVTWTPDGRWIKWDYVKNKVTYNLYVWKNI